MRSGEVVETELFCFFLVKNISPCLLSLPLRVDYCSEACAKTHEIMKTNHAEIPFSGGHIPSGAGPEARSFNEALVEIAL